MEGSTTQGSEAQRTGHMSCSVAAGTRCNRVKHTCWHAAAAAERPRIAAWVCLELLWSWHCMIQDDCFRLRPDKHFACGAAAACLGLLMLRSLLMTGQGPDQSLTAKPRQNHFTRQQRPHTQALWLQNWQRMPTGTNSKGEKRRAFLLV